MRFLSLCSGIEAASVAWVPLGWTPVAYAERDPEAREGPGFAAELLAQRFPRVPNLGDVSRISPALVKALGPIDIVIGGTPCQDLSVAGNRGGIDGSRSSLFFDFVRVFDAARSFCGARFCLWENVPGAFSSNEGRDFARVVGTLAGCDIVAPVDGWGSEGVALGDNGLVEWAVLDAQWFGVAQRRRRVFALLDVGDWQSRGPVLLEPESVRGDSAPSRAAGARATGALTASALDGSSPSGGDGRDGFLISDTLRSSSGRRPNETTLVANTLAANSGRLQIEQTLIPEVADPITASEGSTYTHEGTNNFRLHNVVVDVAAPLTHGGHPGNNAPGRHHEDDFNVVACFDETQITHRENRSTGDPETAALASSAKPPTVALRADASRDGVARTPSPDAEGKVRLRDAGFTVETEVAPTLDTGKPHSVFGADAIAVRRLTPIECERLQGFPDGWTAVEYRGKPASDTVRYAALGNSIATTCLRWIGEALVRALSNGLH